MPQNVHHAGYTMAPRNKCFAESILIYWQCKKGCILERKSKQLTESCVLGKPYALVLHSNGSTSVVVPNKSCKHNVIHPVMVKWFDNEWKNQNSIFHTCSLVDIFWNIKEMKHCIEHIQIIKKHGTLA